MLLVFTSCQSSTSKVTKEPPPRGFPLNIQKGGTYRSLDQIRVRALGVIEDRIKKNPKALSMLTYGWWNPEFVYNDQEISGQDTYAGYWLKFEDDFTYQYGYYEQLMGSGKYYFRLDDKSLYMLDSDINSEPKVWTANHNGELMALVGTHEYKINNGMQIKMVPEDAKPSR